MNGNQYREEIEKEVLTILEERLQKGEMTAERAREIARYIVDHLKPNMTQDQVYQIAKNFDDHFPELIPIVIRVSNEYEDKIKKIVGDHAGKLIKQNKIDEASSLLKKAVK